MIMNARGTFRHALLAGILFSAAPGLAAEPSVSTTAIEARINHLERELAELKALVKSSAATSEKPVTSTPLTVSSASGAKVQLYGFARLDGAYDSGKINPGNTAMWVRPENLNNNDGEWNMTAGATRIGINLSGPDTKDIKLSGNIEMDFFGGGTENNQNPRLRHGWLKAYWPASDFSILAGQTWDVNSSLIPFVDDPALMWSGGNIGSRHPQFRLTKGFSAGEKGHVELTAAAARTIGEANTLADTWNTDPGKDAAIPAIQGRIAWSGPVLVADQPATVALSGHYAEEEWDTDKTGTHQTLDSWSCSVELSMPVSRKLTLAGEYFTGTNLDDYFGGIGQGVNTATVREIRSCGGWGAVRYTPSPSVTINMGGGIDDPRDSDLAAGGRKVNGTIFANIINKITPDLILGIQLSEWRTGYLNSGTAEALRAQSSLTYKF